MPESMTTIGPRLAWAVIAGALLAIAGLFTFYDSPKVFGQQQSTDATLSGLILQNIGIDFGTFDSATLQYTAQVGSHVTQTTVMPAPNHSEASYVIKLDGVIDIDGRIALSAGSNVITVEVTAEDGQTMKTYSVTVTRPVSDNAHLIDLTLSGISIEHGSIFYPPGFSGLVFNYAPSVAHSLTETTVTPTVHHSFATYIIKLDGVTDADGVIALSVGSNVITIEVTAEDGETTKTYTITVTRAPAPLTDATLKRLALSGIDIGGGVGEGADAQSQTSFKASVYHSVSQTTVTPTVNHSGASYVIKLGGVEDADGTISLAVGSNVITVEVTAEDDSTTKTYTATVNRATATAPTTGELSTDDPPVNFRATDVFSDHTIIVLSFPRNRGITGWVLQRYEHDGDEFVSSGSTMRSEVTGSKDLGGESLRVGNSEVEPGALYKWVAQLTNSQGSTVIETSLTVRIPSDETTELSTDATLDWLKLSGIDIGNGADHRAYTAPFNANVYHSVSQTTVTAKPEHPFASYDVKLGGVTDADGTISLAVGSNVITVEITAEDDSTTKTYTATVNRAAATAPTTGELSTDDPPVNFRAIYVSKTFAGFSLGFPRNRGITGYVMQRYEHDGDEFVSSGSASRYESDSDEDYGGGNLDFGDTNVEPGALYKWVATLTNSQGSTVIEKSVTVRIPPDETTESSDATLSDLTLTGMELEKTGGFHAVVAGFAPDHLSYTASVANSVSQTTVSPTVNHSGASYVIKIDGVEDADGVVSLSVGSNVITIEVTAEDGEATKTYTVAVTRAAALSSDATLSDLALSGVDFGIFSSGTTSYTAQVTNSVSQTTVTPTVNHSGASYFIKLDGVTDADGVVSLSVGSNVITVEVTAEDDSTTQTYTLRVTRAAPPSTDATLGTLTLSGIDFGTFDSTTTSYTAQVANSVSQTTVTPTVNHSGANYVFKLGGVTDTDGVISLSVGSNVITVEVTAEDDSTTQTYTVTVTRAAPPSTDATLSSLTLSGIDFGTFAPGTTSYTAQVANSVSQTTVTPTVNDSGASYVIKLGGVTDVDGVVLLSVGSNVITVEVTAEDDSTTRTYTVTVTRAEPSTPGQLSSDAKLSALTLSGIEFGTFDSTTTSYSARVANSVSETTVTPTVNHSESSYVIKLDGVTDADGVVSLAVGANVITIEVTAEDGNTEQTYTVTVTRATPLSTDATLSALSLSGIDFGTFAPGTTSYTAQVANSVSQTTVAPTVNGSGASYLIKLDGATDADGVIALGVGSNVITVEVTAQDGQATQTYTITVTRAEELSSDATLSSLTLSGIDFGTFDPTTTSYRARVASDITETTVTPTVNHSAASYVIKLDGVTDDDGVISLTDGSNVITVEVTAEDGETIQTYTVTVARGASPCLTGGAVSESTNTGLVSDCEVLLAARDALAGSGASRSLNWAVDTPIADWYGVVLSGTPHRVTQLRLHGQDEDPDRGLLQTKLKGKIPPELGQLSELTVLYLHRNNLTGEIPGALNNLAKLEWLYLYDNELDSISGELGSGMAELKRLFAQDNRITGSIPHGLGDMPKLDWLRLDRNRLTGAIPSELGRLSALGKLYLYENRNSNSVGFSGGIPSAFRSLSNLEYLVLHRTGLSGTIPTWLGELSNLEWLSLYDNELTGAIPAELGDLNNLRRLYLHYNDLTGGIPSELGRLSKLTNLWLNNNQLTGAIPSELGELTNLERWRLRNNELTGCVAAGLAAVQDNDIDSLGLEVCTES